MVTKDDLSKYFVLADTLPDKYVQTCIELAHILALPPILGQALYEDLMEQWTIGYLTPEYQDLAEALTPAVSCKALALYMVQEGAHSTPIGLREYKEENSDALSPVRRRELQKVFESNYEFFAEAARIFLQKNASDYPLWNQCSPRKNRPSSGITAAKRRSRDSNADLGIGPALRE